MLNKQCNCKGEDSCYLCNLSEAEFIEWEVEQNSIQLHYQENLGKALGNMSVEQMDNLRNILKRD